MFRANATAVLTVASAKTASLPVALPQQDSSLRVRRAMGNQTLAQMFAGGSEMAARQTDRPLPVQAKLEVGAVDDPLEHEADRVAHHVIAMKDPVPASMTADAAPGIQRKCACGGSCSACQDAERLQMKSAGSAHATGAVAPPIVHDVLRSPGQPLDAATRGFMEPRFGRDFGNVRVHTDESSVESSEALGARAFTLGSHVVFGKGEYSPAGIEGQLLLAHELTHVVQQSGREVSNAPSSAALSIHGSKSSYVARAPGPKRPERVHPAVTAHVTEIMNSFYPLLSNRARIRLWGRSTIVITAITHNTEGRGATPRYFYTVAGNRTSREIRAAMEKLGVERLRPDPRAQGRGPTGAPKDAEQLAFEAAHQDDSRVDVLVVTRQPCPDCTDAIEDVRLHESDVEVVVVPDPAFAPGGSLYRITERDLPPSIPVSSPSAVKDVQNEDDDVEGVAGDMAGKAAVSDPVAKPAPSATPTDLPASPPPPPVAHDQGAGDSATRKITDQTTATTGDPVAAVDEHGLNATGEAAANSGLLAVEVIGKILNHFGSNKQKELAKEKLRSKLVGIAQETAAHPELGVLVLYYYSQFTPNEQSVVEPGNEFVTIRVGYGRTEDEAKKNLSPSAESTSKNLGGPDTVQSDWTPPKARDESKYQAPFFKIATAHFKPGNETLQRVAWIRGHFKNDGEESLKRFLAVTPDFKEGWFPHFYFLRPPKSLRWHENFRNKFGNTELDLGTGKTADGLSLATLADSVPIFASDATTAELFAADKSWGTRDENDELGPLYANFQLLRWAKPEDIEITAIASSEDVAIPELEKAEAANEEASMSAPVRRLYQSLTRPGTTASPGKILERFLAVVPSDLTDDEVDSLTAHLKRGSSVNDFFTSLENSIRKLRSPSGKNGSGGAGWPDFQKATPGGYAPASVREKVRLLLGKVDWSGVQKGSIYFEDVIGKGEIVENTLAYGVDDDGGHWGALVEVRIGHYDKTIPVSVLSSSVLLSEHGEALYGNSALWGQTFRLLPVPAHAKP